MDTALVQPKSVCDEALGILSRLGAPKNAFAREGVMALSPITGELIAQVRITSPEEVSTVVGRATQAFNAWRTVPAPRRGEFVRVLAEELRAAKDDLGRLVTLETGKIVSEGVGEVQESTSPSARLMSLRWRQPVLDPLGLGVTEPSS